MSETATETKIANTRIVFNKGNLDALPFATDGKQTTYYDTNKTNLSLRVGANTKTFILYTRPKHGNPVRITLGKYGEITIKQAADLVSKHLAKLADGINPVLENKKLKAEREQKKTIDSETLQWLFDKYKQEQLIDHKGGSASTLTNFDDAIAYFGSKSITTLKKDEKGIWSTDMDIELSDWLQRPFRSITRQEVLERFDICGISKPKRNLGVLQPIQRTHQVMFKFASSAFNFIIALDELDANENFRNPFDILKVKHRWKKAGVKKRFVDFERIEFLKWWKAVESYQFYKKIVTDYLFFTLLHNGRSNETAPLKWSAVDFELKRVTYYKTKNKLDYTFPMTKMTHEILKRRKEMANDTVYVFEYPDSKTEYIPQDCAYHLEKIGEISGKTVSMHDLRRTWATAARKLKADSRTIDYCLKHTIDDVNEHYFVRNEKEILEVLQGVEDYFLSQVKMFEQRIATGDTVNA